MSSAPEVTVLCLTRNRRKWIPHAVRCFQAQTYEPKRLLIVGDGEDIQDLIPFGDPRISYRHLGNEERPATVGEKRNLGCSLIRSEIIAVQDDDDYYSPDRLSDQIATLDQTGKAVAGYHSACFTDGTKWWKYHGEPNIALGASLCFRREWWLAHRFPHKQVGQDEEFGYTAAAVGQLESVDAQGHLIATIHPGNTSPRQVQYSPWEGLPADFSLPDDRFQGLLK